LAEQRPNGVFYLVLAVNFIYGIGAAIYFKFFINVANMSTDGFGANEKFIPYFFIAKPLG
jgi:hypothetical protein